MRVYVYPVDKEPYFEEVKSIRDQMHLVGGQIMSYEIADGLFLVCNIEGKINHLPMNYYWVKPYSQRVLDVVCGTFFIMKLKDVSRNIVGNMTPKDVEMANHCLVMVKPEYRVQNTAD